MRHALAFAELPVALHEVGVAHAAERGQHLARPDGQQRQTIHKGAGHVEQREAVDLHRRLVDVIERMREPGRVRLVAGGVLRELGRTGGAAGVEQRHHSVGMQVGLEGERLWLCGHQILQRGSVGHRFIHLDGHEHRGVQSLHGQCRGPHRQFLARPQGHQHLGVRGLQQRGDVVGLQQEIDRTHAARQLRAPEHGVSLGRVGREHGHGIGFMHTERTKGIGRAVDVGQQLAVGHAPRRRVQPGVGQKSESLALGKTLSGGADERVRASVWRHRCQWRTLQHLNVRKCCKRLHARPRSRTALPFRMPGITSGLKPATSKSFIQRSGVISG